MNILCLIKQVPDTASSVFPSADGKDIAREGLGYVINPYDEYGIEEALRIREKQGGSVTLITMGADKAEAAVRQGLAIGADSGIHIKDAALAHSDSFATAQVLVKTITTLKLEYDLIFCGKQAVDDDYAEAGPMVAEFLNIPFITLAVKVEFPDAKTVKVHRELEGEAEIIEATLPLVITCQKGLNEPRLPSLKGIMEAKKKAIKAVGLSELGLSADSVGSAASKIELIGLSLPPEKKGGKILEGEPDAVVKEVVKLLREEAKVI